MSKDEFISKMKELGWSDRYISETIQLHEEAEEKGINIPFDMELIEAPRDYP